MQFITSSDDAIESISPQSLFRPMVAASLLCEASSTRRHRLFTVFVLQLELPEENNVTSKRIRNFIDHLNAEKPYPVPVQVIR